jgi:chemotaxis protein MotB
MAMEDTTPVIRIVRKTGGHEAHHGGAWKVAYADFVTAMMAFFLVMWILGLSKPVREAIASYFKDPAGFVALSHGGKSPLASGNEKDLSLTHPKPIFPQQDDSQRIAMGLLKAEFANAEKQIIKAIEQSPELAAIRNSVEIKLTDEGLRIELIEKTHSVFFDTGSAAVKPHTVHLLHLVAREMAVLDRPVVVEGHTDSRPLARADGYSNWELSADRANAARRILETGGLRPGQVISVRGFADRRPLVPNNPFNPANRRVSILVAYTGKDQ